MGELIILIARELSEFFSIVCIVCMVLGGAFSLLELLVISTDIDNVIT